MAIRIRIDKDKADLVNALVKDNTAPFKTYADVLAFAAALGAKYKRRIPLENIAKEPEPISLEVFLSRGYDLAIKLLAITETKEPKILSHYEITAEEERVLIFEEYANGGLEKLQNELKGTVDYTERILLVLSGERFREQSSTEEFDLSRFL
jgi:dnd system-associated protein 4